MGNVPDYCRHASALANVTSYERLSECWTEKWLADALRLCLPLIILPVSLINNCLSFIALRSRHMRGTSTAFFMLLLSVLDPLVLITKNLLYFPTFVSASASSCKLLYFLVYVVGYTNVWILVIMTADKFFAVWFPLRVSYFCTTTRAKCVFVSLLLMTSVISVHHFWTIDSYALPYQSTVRYCNYNFDDDSSMQRTWRYLDLLIWCFVPFILIFSLSVLIIYKLRQRRQASLHLNAQREGRRKRR